MTAGHTLILFGVSGVGKTTAAQAAMRRFPDLLHFQASTLLKAALAQSGEALRTADASRIASNQTGLYDALCEARSLHLGRPALLDAHSVIDNDVELVDISLEVFAAIQPAAIALLLAPPATLLRRRLEDQRARPERSLEELERYQRRSEDAARGFAISLNVPFAAFDTDDQAELMDYIGHHLEV